MTGEREKNVYLQYSLEGRDPGEIYRRIGFRETLEEIFPKVKGTPVPKILAGLALSVYQAVKPIDNESEIRISESAAQILCWPSEKGRQAVKAAQEIEGVISDKQGLINPFIRNSIEGLSEGPDLDLKIEVETGFHFPALGSFSFIDFRNLQKTYLGKILFLDWESADQKQSQYVSDRDDLVLTIKELDIPVYDLEETEAERIRRPLFELRFQRKNGELILKTHITSSPEGTEAFKAECRLGTLVSAKQFFSVLPIVFSENFKEIDAVSDCTDSLFINIFSQDRYMLTNHDWYMGVADLYEAEKYPARLMISALRMAVIALLTQTEEQIRRGEYLWPYDQENLSAAFNRIKQGRVGLDLPDQARQEITTSFLLGCLIETDLFIKIASELEILIPFKAGEKEPQEIVSLVKEIKKADPEKITQQLNELADLFSFV